MKKLLNKKGFTLMEMMIVIAIIVILVAIAVPSFNASLDKANKATDAANFRAAESAAMVKAMDDKNHGKEFYYDLDAGDVLAFDADKAAKNHGSCTTHSKDYIKVSIAADGAVTVTWSTSGGKGCE